MQLLLPGASLKQAPVTMLAVPAACHGPLAATTSQASSSASHQVEGKRIACWDVLGWQRFPLKKTMWRVGGLTRNLSSQATVKATSLKTDKPDKPAGSKQVVNEVKKLAVIDVDPMLADHQVHLNYRMQEYLKRKTDIEKVEGSLLDFAKGYEKYGFTREEDGILYQEWAPAAAAAQLIGDFNNWDGSKHTMKRDEFGVWSIRLPDADGVSAIPHGSKVKFRMQKGDGTWVDRIPAWIKFAIVDPTVFAAYYDGVYWDPPASERYEFKHARPAKPAAPLIYEAHVGMSSKEPQVASYRQFADEVLPRIKANNYNTIQLMAIMEHAYYGCFGYHVTNFFAASSRCGTPEDLKYLIDKAHSMGLRVLMDVVHSHASTNAVDGLAGYDLGQVAQDSYFHTGARGYHKLWDSRLFNYGSWEVQRFLLSNLRWWMEEYMFDGFRFDGVTSMLYHHHGLNMCFTGNYHEYFSENTDTEAVMYLMLANELVHSIYPDATMIAEDVSGMPTLCRSVAEGGVGFDYRLAMAIPDKWIQYLKERKDEEWSMGDIVYTLVNRRYTEACVGYAESHDQSMVGDKTFAFLLMDKEMYFSMSAQQPANLIVDRGVALHKMIHFITLALGGEGYLNFMGNEFGHPEWIDFPRQGNNWSLDKCRRRWDLCDADHLRYKFMNNFNRAMIALAEEFEFVSSSKQYISLTSETEKLIVFERGDLVFIFNFHPTRTYSGMKVGCEIPGKYRICLDSDAGEFGGHSRVDHNVDHFTNPEPNSFNNRPHSFMVMSPSRSCQVYYKVPE
jgi:1,4-alpha-glucan branching enzyme